MESYIHVSQSPPYRSPPSRVPQGAFKRGCSISKAFHKMQPSEFPVKEPSLQVALIGLPERERRSIHKELFDRLSNKRTPPSSSTGPLKREKLFFRTSLYTSFWVPSKGALPRGARCRTPTETDAPFTGSPFMSAYVPG
jgi:hypothetical protein